MPPSPVFYWQDENTFQIKNWNDRVEIAAAFGLAMTLRFLVFFGKMGGLSIKRGKFQLGGC